MPEKKKTKRTCGSGSLVRRGRIWDVNFREVLQGSDGSPVYVQHRESTRSDDIGVRPGVT